MATVYDAIELWSANLHEQIRMLCGQRGWACKSHAYLIAPRPMEFKSFVGTTVHLPGGMGASFVPRSEPTGDTWVIDVRRSDGKVPQAALGGLMVMRSGSGREDNWGVRSQVGPLTDVALAEILEELGR